MKAIDGQQEKPGLGLVAECNPPLFGVSLSASSLANEYGSYYYWWYYAIPTTNCHVPERGSAGR